MGVVRFLFHLSLRLVFLSFAFSSVSALSASSYLDPSRILFQRPDAATQLELIDCFRNGNCEQDDKIRIYPMPCNGSGGADCTGCYAMRGSSPVRIGDLDLTTGSCAGVGSDSEEKIRVFVGYERKCPSGTPVGGTCTGDGQIILSCSISSDGEFVYDKECFSGTPYVRRAKIVAGTVTVLPSNSAPAGQTGCDAGTTGIYPACVPCSDTSYKPTIGNTACTECASPDIVHSATRNYTTAGTTKTSVNDCRVADFTCMSGYTKNTVKQTCDIPIVNNPPPSPTPTPTDSTIIPPSQWTCADANVRMTTDVSKSTSPSYDYVSSARFSWSKGDASGGLESVLVVFDQIEAPFYKKMYPFNFSGTSSGLVMMGPSSPGNPGNYRVVARYTVNGIVCPELGPLYFTVPSTPGFVGGP